MAEPTRLLNVPHEVLIDILKSHDFKNILTLQGIYKNQVEEDATWLVIEENFTNLSELPALTNNKELPNKIRTSSFVDWTTFGNVQQEFFSNNIGKKVEEVTIDSVDWYAPIKEHVLKFLDCCQNIKTLKIYLEEPFDRHGKTEPLRVNVMCEGTDNEASKAVVEYLKNTSIPKPLNHKNVNISVHLPKASNVPTAVTNIMKKYASKLTLVYPDGQLFKVLDYENPSLKEFNCIIDPERDSQGFSGFLKVQKSLVRLYVTLQPGTSKKINDVVSEIGKLTQLEYLCITCMVQPDDSKMKFMKQLKNLKVLCMNNFIACNGCDTAKKDSQEHSHGIELQGKYKNLETLCIDANGLKCPKCWEEMAKSFPGLKNLWVISMRMETAVVNRIQEILQPSLRSFVVIGPNTGEVKNYVNL